EQGRGSGEGVDGLGDDRVQVGGGPPADQGGGQGGVGGAVAGRVVVGAAGHPVVDGHDLAGRPGEEAHAPGQVHDAGGPGGADVDGAAVGPGLLEPGEQGGHGVVPRAAASGRGSVPAHGDGAAGP